MAPSGAGFSIRPRLLCKTFSGGYTRSVTVKARFFIFVSALVAVLLLGPALRAQGHVRTADLRTDAGSISITAGFELRLHLAGTANHRHDLVASPLQHHKPATRVSRKRGKKISIQSSGLPATRCYSPGRYLVPFASAARQHPRGPNPSRGPPSLLYL